MLIFTRINSFKMTAVENLYFAIGELAYAVASADGAIQKHERQKFHNIVVKELNNNNFNINVSDIIFKMLDKEKSSSKDSYNWAMHQIKINSHYLSPQLKETFMHVIAQIAEAYPPVTDTENVLLERFKTEIADINGDPVYYSNNS